MSNNRLRIYDKFSLGIQLKINQSRKDNRDDYAEIKYSADAFILLRLPFTSDEAKKLNQEIFETMYYAALEKSMLISLERYEKMRFLREQ